MDKIEGTVLGDNKFVIISMEEKDTVELDVDEFTEFKELFKNINDVEEVINTLITSGNSISANDITKTIITLIKANQDNTETILNFLLYIASHEMKNLQIKYNDLIIKTGKGFYDSGMEDARHCDCCSEEEVTTVSNLNDALKENSDTYDSNDNQKPLFDEDNEYDKASTLWDDHMKEIREKLSEDHNHQDPEFEILGHDEVEEI